MSRDITSEIWIDQVCDRFEHEYKTSGHWPDLDTFVNDCSITKQASQSSTVDGDQPASKAAQHDDLQHKLLNELITIRLSHKPDSVNEEANILIATYPLHRKLIETIAGSLTNAPSMASGIPFVVNQVRSTPSHQQTNPFRPGQTVGNFVLERHIGSGGMGTVWSARQTQPVKRNVAIKFMRQKLVTPQSRLRFRAEQQALAILNHPGIAKILAAGETEAQQPYFVMELMAGEPITQFAINQQLKISQRVELFIQVCEAVIHAHQKGVIHRDLKPKNVLMSEIGEHAHPKIIDFGLAKATHQSLTDESLNTIHGQILGTPEYMSPEQTWLNSRDIDTRTDIYSLGALLYELITGSSPLSDHLASEKNLEESLNVIREVDPLPPSQRYKGSASTDGVPRELDWIVLKCLFKDRQHRYHSVHDLKKDLHRFLSGEPVDAAPPSKAYRFKKFYDKHRAGVIATAVSFLFLIAGLAGTGIALGWAIVAQNESEQRAQALSVAVEDIKAAKRDTDARSKQLLELTAFQQKQIEQIDPSQAAITLRTALLENFRDAIRRDPPMESTSVNDSILQFEQGLARINFIDVSLTNLQASFFEPALAAIRNDYSDQPLVRARLLSTTAASLETAGLLPAAELVQKEAVEIFRNQLPNSDPEFIRNLYELERILADNSKFKESNDLILELEKLSKQNLDNKHPVSLLVEARIAEKSGWVGRNFNTAIPAYQKVIDTSVEVHGESHPSTIQFKTNFAALLRLAGHYREAASLFEEIIQSHKRSITDNPIPLIRSLNHLANTINNFEPSIPNIRSWELMKESFALAEESLGRFHPVTISSLHELGAQEGYYHDRKNGEKLLLDAASRCRVVFGDVNDQILGVNQSLIGVYWIAERDAEAIEILKSQIRNYTQLHGPDYADVHLSRIFLARCYHRIGKTDAAIQQIMLAEKNWRGKAATRVAQADIMQIFLDAEKFDLATEIARQHIAFVKKTKYTLPIDYCVELTIGWKWLFDLNRFAEAEPLIRECLSIRQQEFPDQWQTIETELLLGLCLERQEKSTEADSVIVSAHQKLIKVFDRYSTNQRKEIFRVFVNFQLIELALPLAIAEVKSAQDQFPAGSLERLKAMSVGWAWMMQLGRFQEAEPAIKECLEIHQKIKPEHWKTFDLSSQYGECLTEIGKAKQALPFLMRGYHGLKSRVHSIPPSMMGKIGYSLDRIVTCHQKLGDQNEAKRWQKKLDTFNQTIR